MKRLVTPALAATLLAATGVHAQAQITAAARATAEGLRDRAMAGQSVAYPLLEQLTTEIGPRPAGSAAEHRAARWGADTLRRLGFENVRIESFPVNYWVRGEERAEVTGLYPQRLVVAALGGSVATPPGGIEAEIALFRSFDDMLAAPAGSLAGKIAVVTQPMARTGDGSGYGASYRIRGQGAVEAARRGAVGYLMRSLASDERRLPHTGTMSYEPAPGQPASAAPAPRIPAAALSVPDALQLERLVARGRPVRVHLLLTPTIREAVPTDTVIGEIPGRGTPGETVLIGGHLDSWDLGTGAIDDGAGVAIATAAAKLIRDLPTRPRRTIRVVMFGAEEIGRAGEAYAAMHKSEEAGLAIASEADFGADRVYSIQLPAGAAAGPFGRTLATVVSPLKIFVNPRAATDGGADLEHLQGVPLASLNQDGTRYFDLHHTADDTLDKVDRAQLDQVVAAWAAFTYLAAESPVDFRAVAQQPAPGEARR